MKIRDENILIRQASVKDTNLIAVLGAVTFYEAYVEQDEPPDLADYIVEAFSVQKIRDELENLASTFFIVYLNNVAVGYAKLRENNKITLIKDKNAIELQRLYLIEKVYRTGIGTVSLNHCFEAAKQKNYQRIWLSVWKENKRAIRFYEKHQFTSVGETSFPYGSTVGTNLIMQKEL